MTSIRKLLAWSLLLSATLHFDFAHAANFQYFRMFGGGSGIIDAPANPPAGTLSYAVSGPSAATVGQAYSATSVVTGAVGAPVFSVQSGSLPPGLSINGASGVISGVPGASGTFNATLKVTDAASAAGFASFHLVVSPSFSVSGTASPIATVGQPYAAQFAANGGMPPYQQWAGEGLPSGLTVSADGLLSGVPAAPSDYSVTVSVQDSSGNSAQTAPFQIQVRDPIAIAWSPGDGETGVTYTSATPVVSGGRLPVLFSLVGQVPDGLSLSNSSGVLTGIPVVAGAYTLALAAIDADGRSATSAPITLTVVDGGPPPPDPAGALALTGTPGLIGQIGVGYVAHFTAVGGAAPYTFAMASGTLPDGLSLDPATGIISGQPTAVGTYSGLQVKVTDAASAVALSGVFSIAVQPTPDLLIAGNPSSSAVVGQAYSATFQAFDGTGAGYSFTSIGASLPPGLTLTPANGTQVILSGVPTYVGTYSGVKIRVTDSGGNTADTSAFSITVAPAAGPLLTLNGPSSNAATLSESYSGQYSANGGSAPYTFDLAAGSVPDGLTLTSSGVLSGAASQVGSYFFVVRVTDAVGSTATLSTTFVVSPSLNLETPALADATWGSSYSYALIASGGRPPYHFTQSGMLPAGISLEPSTGVISGVPSGGGIQSFAVAISAIDADGRVVTKNAGLTVYPPASFVGYLPPRGVVGAPYAYVPTGAQGGSGQFTYQVLVYGMGTPSTAISDLGLSFDSATGAITGVPTIAGTSPQFGVRATDAVRGSNFDIGPLNLTIDPAVQIVGSPPAAATVGQIYTTTFSASGGSGSRIYSVQSGTLPAWLSIDAATGVLSGTPSAGDIGTVGPLVMRVHDDYGVSDTSAFSIAVAAPLTLSGAPSPAQPSAAYSFDLTTITSGGRAPYAYSLISGVLPAGMTLSSDGMVSATDVTGTSTTPTLRVADADGRMTDALFSFVVGNYVAEISHPLNVRSGQPIAGTLSTDLPGASWSLTQAPTTPSLGLSVSGVTFSGSAPFVSTSTSYDIVATATAGAISAQSSPSTLTVHPALAISGGPSGTLTTTIDSSFGPTATPTVSGLVGTATYALLKAGNPYNTLETDCGLTFGTATGTISGAPASVACTQSDLTIQVIDDFDGSQVATSGSFTVIVGATNTFFTLSATEVRRGAAISGSVASSLQSPTWTFSQTPVSPSLGLSVTGNGVVSGTAPEVSARTVFTIEATGSHNTFTGTSSSVTLAVNPTFVVTGGLPSGGSYSGFIGSAFPSAQPAYAPVGLVGTMSFEIRDQVGAVLSNFGATCPGLSFSTSTGKITGTPTAVCSGQFSVRVTDSFDGARSVPGGLFTVTVSPPSINFGGTPPIAANGSAYSFALTTITSGGSTPYSYALISGSLPTGLSLASSGTISGTVGTNAISTTATIRVTDADTQSVNATLSFAVTGAPSNAWAFGLNSAGQLGDGTTTQRLTKVSVRGGATYTQIAAGGNHSCGLVNNGTVQCWGNNINGALGDGTSASSSLPVTVPGITGATYIAVGNSISCAVVSGAVKCWGYNYSGQVGDGTTTNRYAPTQVSGLTSGVTMIAMHDSHACALVSGGVKCWGAGTSGQLGNGSIVNSSVPVQVSGLTSGATAIAVGGSHSCVVISGSMKCWGSGAGLGNGSTARVTTPTQVSGLTSGVSAIGAGDTHTCAVQSGGVKCWGYNFRGEVGNGTTSSSYVPVQVVGLTSGATQLSLGAYTSCAIVSGGARCWGRNDTGELGVGNTTQATTSIAPTGLSSGVSQISVGSQHTLVR